MFRVTPVCLRVGKCCCVGKRGRYLSHPPFLTNNALGGLR
ncbi:unnamed protein product [Rodentolepis nana]|uniref:DUF3265 domain-containing protein n=1 Tax=Rodentolepis nana TaxID=102285 RepID=A0A0R3TUW4_RODNA|nr:unnamed protein product [Rodentolepis nana]